eukprot:5348752-Pleurochrysis_carterae.AAC.16
MAYNRAGLIDAGDGDAVLRVGSVRAPFRRANKVVLPALEHRTHVHDAAWSTIRSCCNGSVVTLTSCALVPMRTVCTNRPPYLENALIMR